MQPGPFKIVDAVPGSVENLPGGSSTYMSASCRHTEPLGAKSATAQRLTWRQNGAHRLATRPSERQLSTFRETTEP